MKSKIAATAIAALALTGCQFTLDETNPVSVATGFWAEALSDDKAAAASLMKRQGKLKLGIKGYDDEDTAIMGEVKQNGGIYFIDTNLSIWRNDLNFAVPLKTIVVPDDTGKWKVDYWSTLSSLNDAAIDNSIKYIANSHTNYQNLFDQKPDQADRQAAVDAAEYRLDQEFARAKDILMKNIRKSYGVPEPKEDDKKK